MGLTYAFTFHASANVTAAELQDFLKSVEADAQRMGFSPTLVFTATFTTPEQREFARRIHISLPMRDEKLERDALPCGEQVLDFDAKAGRCRLLPVQAEVLVVTDEYQNETVFAFARYPEVLKDINRRPLLKILVGGEWHFSNFIQSPDPRYRQIVKRFADAGYVKAVSDDFASKST